MRFRLRTVTMTAALAIGGGFLISGPGTGCTSFLAEAALSAADFCFIFDCQAGMLGGTVRPCPPGASGTGEAVLTPPTGLVFEDCP